MTLNPHLRNRLAKTIHDATCGGVCFKEHPARYLTAADKAAELLTASLPYRFPDGWERGHEAKYWIQTGLTPYGLTLDPERAPGVLNWLGVDYYRADSPHLPASASAPSVLPTVEEVARAICEPDGNAVEGDHEYHLTAARAALDLIASRIRHWGDPVAPGTVIKKGTRYRAESDVEAYELTAMRDWTVPEENTRRVYIDAATVPVPEDPAVAAVVDWMNNEFTGPESARDLLARIDAVRGVAT